jgi:glutamyl-tRNA reductase
MDLVLVGMNHRTAAVEVRERFALASCPRGEPALVFPAGVKESLLLSTCNRVEILAAGDGPDVRDSLLAAWARRCSGPERELAAHVYALKDEEAVRHVFAVTASLDSMILGEPQILGQMKEAYRAAVAAGTTGMLLNRLMHKAFSVAKRVRSETGIAEHAVSVSYAAVQLGKRIFENMGECSALLIGAGEMAELAAAHLKQAGVRRLTVINRTAERGEELGERFQAETAAWESLPEHLLKADIVISSTGAPGLIVTADDIRPLLRKRRNRPMFFIDIAVPRDIDPALNACDNIYVYDIDDLKDIVEENKQQRQFEAGKAQAIINEECAAFGVWRTSLALQPTIVDLIRRHEAYAEEELARALKRLGPERDPRTVECIRKMAFALLRKIDHDPIAFLKSGHDGAQAEMLDIARRLFALDKKKE